MTHAELDAGSSADTEAVVEAAPPEPPVALPDDKNPAIIDARKTMIVTVIGTLMFIASVIVFIL